VGSSTPPVEQIDEHPLSPAKDEDAARLRGNQFPATTGVFNPWNM
jgi:hypothetical protein